MKEKPILFSAPMVQAILDDTKSQTRRVIKPQPVLHRDITKITDIIGGFKDGEGKEHKLPYQVGDRLWVKETWQTNLKGQLLFEAQYENIIELLELPDIGIKWKSSMFMPKKYARIWLEVTGVRVERVQDISEEDAKVEGVEVIKCRPPYEHITSNYTEAFERLWDSINGKKYPWSSNPWVWVIEFRKI